MWSRGGLKAKLRLDNWEEKRGLTKSCTLTLTHSYSLQFPQQATSNVSFCHAPHQCPQPAAEDSLRRWCPWNLQHDGRCCLPSLPCRRVPSLPYHRLYRAKTWQCSLLRLSFLSFAFGSDSVSFSFDKFWLWLMIQWLWFVFFIWAEPELSWYLWNLKFVETWNLNADWLTTNFKNLKGELKSSNPNVCRQREG